MDKVSNTSPQAMPLWDRQKNQRGHRSSVDGALEAHRQRRSERQARVQERLNIVRGMQNQFFPQQSVGQEPSLVKEEFQASQMRPPVVQQPVVQQPEVFNPRGMDDILEEAQLGRSSSQAINIVNTELANPNPEDGPVDDMPKGSYIDYTV